MKLAFRKFSCLYIILICGLNSEAVQQRMPITSNGETILVADSAKFNVRVKIRTHKVQIGKRPDIIRSSCTYSKYPCSIVDYIDITVSNKPLFVPRSVFCGLADLNTAEVTIGQKESILTLIGGDASESYIVKIEFDAEHIKRRSLAPLDLPDEPLQETTYHRRILRDE